MLKYKIIWLADYDVSDHKGGAQQTNETMIKAGRRSFQIDFMKPEDFNKDKLREATLVITNNITKFEEDDLYWLTQHIPYVRFEHDYWAVTQGAAKGNLFRGSLANIFLSPMHYKESCKIFGDNIKNKRITPSAVDTTLFRIDKEVERIPQTVIYAGQVCSLKGYREFDQFINEHPEKKFIVCGWGEDANNIKVHKNVEFHETMEQKDLLKLYQSSQYFYHRPEWKEPFGRSVMEAYLCGCSLLINENIGAMSWDWNWEDYDFIVKQMEEAPANFWKIIKDVIAKNNLE